ncbi:hypothetical protein T265_02666 [Opisthorchis viverrini]|uniref:Uncharacterized protein n=1 Tax=Opisthorchis viverrini TaxID=6198 RepID=A0A074ZYB8_OPIVI|nr:hypothetical protein T265_02666 [Opisthorchis viverrini]KER30987.1 hypothetical protein T265_02666 [Opisthorchis viverrini]
MKPAANANDCGALLDKPQFNKIHPTSNGPRLRNSPGDAYTKRRRRMKYPTTLPRRPAPQSEITTIASAQPHEVRLNGLLKGRTIRLPWITFEQVLLAITVELWGYGPTSLQD